MPIEFGPFRLDPANERLWRGGEALRLKPKAFAVLRHLVQRPGRLVTKSELLDALWPGVHVGDAVLKVCVREIRQVLDDEARVPRFIETVHRRGYRFLGAAGDGEADRRAEAAPATAEGRGPPLVGREPELARLRGTLREILTGRRRLVLVAGEPGIGKTCLVEHFAAVAAEAGVVVGRGQCVDQAGAREAYLCVLEAARHLCDLRPDLVPLLRRHAPTWLAQMPALVEAGDREALAREVLGTTPARMLREMAEALEAMSAVVPVMLVLEDLHWSDHATVELLAWLARRSRPARLLVIGTYRPVDAIVAQHPLRAARQELGIHGLCDELILDFLGPDAVRAYLDARFPRHALPDGLAPVLHDRTDGVPLFMRDVVDHLVATGAFARLDGRWALVGRLGDVAAVVPDSLRHLVDRITEGLEAETREVIETASIGGVEFSVGAVAAVLGWPAEQVTSRCETLVRRRQLARGSGMGSLPDGSHDIRYAFVHALHQSAVYERVGSVRRLQLHARMGAHREALYGARAPEIALELVRHFEAARDARRAIEYLRHAAATATRRQANADAVSYLSRALALADLLPPEEHGRARMPTLEPLGMVRRAMGDTRGAAEAFEALAQLARAHGDGESEVRALFYLASSLVWVDADRCLATARRAVESSAHLADGALGARARGAAGYWHSMLRGWHPQDARACLAALDSARRAGDRGLVGLLLGRVAYFQCLGARYRAAQTSAAEGPALALAVGDAYEYMICQYHGAMALLFAGEWGELGRVLDDCLALARRNDSPRWAVLFESIHAWLALEAGRPRQARDRAGAALDEARVTGYRYGQVLSLTLLGRACLELGEDGHAARCLAEGAALVQDRGPEDAMIRMRLAHGRARAWLARQARGDARREARWLHGAAVRCGERTWQALGLGICAEVSSAERDWPRAERELAAAVRLVAGGAAPLAEWRVWETAGRLHRARRHPRQGARCEELGRVARSRLLASLQPDSAIARTLLAEAGPDSSRR